jgi:hypothetical protein
MPVTYIILLWAFQIEIWDTETIRQEAMLHCAGMDSADSTPKAEPLEQRGLPYMPLQAGYRSKKQRLTYIWLHATLLAISLPPPLCYVTFFTFQFF